MKIVLCPLHYLPVIGGAEVQVHHLAKSFQKLNHQVIAIVNHTGSTMREDLYEGVLVYRFPFLSSLERKDLRSIRKIFDKIGEILSTFSPDVINTHALFAPLNFYHNRFIHSPLCVTTHGGMIEAEDGKKQEVIKLLSKANQISAPAQNFLNFLGLVGKNIRVIPNGLAFPRTPLSPIPAAPRVALIGRFAKEKGFDTALIAIHKIAAKHPQLKAFLIGDGPLFPLVERQIQELQIGHIVELTGPTSPRNVHHWIDRSQIVIVPSTHECLNLVALEAGLRGRAVIASDIPGLQESVEDGKTGYLIPPNAPQALSERLDQLLSNFELIKQMGICGFAKISRQYSLEKTVEKYLEMYQCAVRNAS